MAEFPLRRTRQTFRHEKELANLNDLVREDGIASVTP